VRSIQKLNVLVMLSAACVASVGLIQGCIGRGERSITSDDPAVKVPLIRDAVDRNDRSILPQLVKDLNSEDPAIRFYAVDGLRRLTGEHFGYDWRGEEDDRKKSVEQWNQHVKSIASTLPAYRGRQ
jgi:hypothetical protein